MVYRENRINLFKKHYQLWYNISIIGVATRHDPETTLIIKTHPMTLSTTRLFNRVRHHLLANLIVKKTTYCHIHFMHGLLHFRSFSL